jgi:hypothetical protein
VRKLATRRERVVLELDDRFTSGMAKAAAAAALFDKQISKSGKSTDSFGRDVSKAEGQTNRLSGTLSRSTRDLDSYSGRLGILASTIGAIGPAAVPITAVAIPAVTGLAQQLGLAALAGGTAVLAFQGVGDALTAMNKAHLEPTAANLEKAREAMERLSPAAQGLVLKLESMRGELGKLKDAAGSGILPGATAALDDLEKRLPIVERILHQVSMAVGDALRDGAASLAGPEWDKFFKFIATEARPELTKLAKSVGNVAHGLAEMWIAFGPLNSDFSSWMLKASRDFNAWATGLSKTEGFQEFVAYIHENGPKVGAALAAIANALLQIVEAAAPMGGPILDALTAVANVIADIADSDLGTPIFGMIAAFSAASLAMKAFGSISTGVMGSFVKAQVGAGKAIRANVVGVETLGVATEAVAAKQAGLAAKSAAGIRTLAGGAGRLGLAAAAFSGLADNVGLSTAAMGGFVAGPWGAGAGLLYDVASSGNAAGDALDRLRSAVDSSNFSTINAGLAETTAEIDKQKNSVSGYLKLAIQGIHPHGGMGGTSLFNFDDTGLGRQIAERNALEQASGDLRLGIQTVGQFNGLGSSGTASSLEDLQRVIQKVKPAMDDLGISMDDLAQGARDGSIVQMGKDINAWLANPLNRAKLSADQFKASIESVYATLSKRASMRDFEAAIDAATKSLKDNGKTLDIHTEKGRNNQAALDNIANTALKVAEGLKGVNRVKMLAQARDDFARTAHSMGMSWDAANALADKLIQLDKVRVRPEIDVDTDSAMASLRGLQAQLSALHDKHIAITVSHGNSDTVGADPLLADGGFVRGPGGPRDDKIPARLSNGEFVVNANATARNLPLLHSINAQRFADGGLATYTSRRDRSYGERAGGQSSSRIAVDLGDVRITGILQSNIGPVQVEGWATAAARSVVSDSADLAGTHARMYTGGGERG